jgi:hypothetical protein
MTGPVIPTSSQSTELKGGSRGEPDSWRGDPSSGLRSRRSGISYGSSGSGAGAGLILYLHQNT